MLVAYTSAPDVAAELRRLSQRLPNTRILTLCGGRPYRGQLAALKHGNHVIVGTPGLRGDSSTSLRSGCAFASRTQLFP